MRVQQILTFMLLFVSTGLMQEMFLQEFTCAGFEVTHGHVVPAQSTFHSGQVAEVTCDQGYQLFGRRRHQCDEYYGGWNGNRPACVEVQVACLNPGLKNGMMEYSSGSGSGDILTSVVVTKRDVILAGDDVTFRCGKDFVMHVGQVVHKSEHAVTVTCGRDGQWAGPLPTCLKPLARVTCANPRVRGATMRRWTKQRTTLQVLRPVDHVVPGDSVEVQCVDGFHMTRPDPPSDDEEENQLMVGLTCRHDGTWNKVLPHCTRFACDPPPLGRGLLVDANRTFHHGDSANYTCAQGYELLGPPSLLCTMNINQWFPHTPTCRRLRCPTLRWPEHGHSVLADRITTHCHEGHELVGSAQRECLTNGSWSGSPAICRRLDTVPPDCGDPGSPDGGFRSGDDFRSGSTVTFTCEPGCTTLGDVVSTCDKMGNWTAPPPRCLGPDEYTDAKYAFSRWVEIIQQIDAENQDGGSHHVFLLTDSSGSMTNAELNAERTFVGTVANKFHFTALSLVVFNDTAVLLANRTDGAGITHALKTSRFSSGGGTSLKKALSFVKLAAGKRKSVIIILNDAINQGGTLSRLLTRRFQARPVPAVYVLTLGGYVTRRDLVKAVSLARPTSSPQRSQLDFLFFLKTWEDLNTLSRGIRIMA